MIDVAVTVCNPIKPDTERVEHILFMSEWACKIMCAEYVKCSDVLHVTAVNKLTGEIIFHR